MRFTESSFLQWKAHFVTKTGFGSDDPVFHRPPLLFNLAVDPSERLPINVTANPQYQYVLDTIYAAVAHHRRDLVVAQDQTSKCCKLVVN